MTNEDNKIRIDLSSNRSFEDLNAEVSAGNKFITGVAKSLKGEFFLSYNPNFVKKLSDIAEKFKIKVPKEILFVLGLKNFTTEFKFENWEEVPEGIQEFLENNTQADGFALPKEELLKKVFGPLVELINPGWELYGTLENAVALKVNANFPGFTSNLLRKIDQYNWE